MNRAPIPHIFEIPSDSSVFFDALLEADHHSEHDIAQRNALETAIAESRINPISGLPNKKAFDEELNKRIEENRDLAVAVIDITHFKSVNDTLGHQKGDLFLHGAGQVLDASFLLGIKTRHHDYKAHLSGDEFAVIFDMSPRQDDTMSPIQRVEAIRLNLIRLMAVYSESMLPDDLNVTAAIGISLLHPGQSASDVFESADTAMYAHKSSQHELFGTVPR